MSNMTSPFKTTHAEDWRRVRWVYDNEYQGLVEGIDEPDAEAKAVAQRELEDLHNGKLICLGAIVETKCLHCEQWMIVDSLWNIIVQPEEDLEALGSEILEIPETAAPEEIGCPVLPSPPPPPEGPSNTMHKKGDTTPRKPRGPGLARIVLQFDPDTLRALRNAVYVRRLTSQSAGLLDAFMVKLIEKIAAGEQVWEVKQKKEVD